MPHDQFTKKATRLTLAAKLFVAGGVVLYCAGVYWLLRMIWGV